MNELDRLRRGAHGPWLLAGALSTALALFAVACISVTRHVSAPQVSSEASAALEEARTWARSNEPAARERSRAAVQRAIALAPDWIGPRRVYDEMRRDDLLGIEALAEHRAALEKNPDDPVELYLAGRLEGSLGYDRFLRAAQVAPNLAWSQHGLGFISAEHHDWALAVRHAELALSLARDPWERSYFTATLARYLVGGEKLRPALAVLEALTVTETIRRLVIKRASAAVIKNQAMNEGMKTLRKVGIEKALEGITTLEEVWRVTAEDQ